MEFKKERLISAYRRIISLYPQELQERFGESMEQTFRDICNETIKEKGVISFIVVVSLFTETLLGAFKENVDEMRGLFMENVYLRVFFAALIGLLGTAPFFIMELIYSGGFPQGVPYAVFGFLFVCTTIFVLLVYSAFRTLFNAPLKNWILPFSLKLLGAVPLVLSWTHMVSDQMPCFLGGRGC